jgi:hypothetical protein
VVFFAHRDFEKWYMPLYWLPLEHPSGPAQDLNWSESVSRKLMLLLCVSVPSFMINLDANIVAVSLSSIAKSLHADFAAIEWVISAYTLAFATLVLPAGTLVDRFGRKRVLIVSCCWSSPTSRSIRR